MIKRFICETIPEIGEHVVLSDVDSHHLQIVLRGTPGDQIQLLDGRGTIAESVIVDLGKKSRKPQAVCCINQKKIHTPSNPNIILIIALLKQKVLSQIIRQAVQLGVCQIQPVITQYAVVNPRSFSISKHKIDICESCKQSGNPYFPTITLPTNFGDTLKNSDGLGFVGSIPNKTNLKSQVTIDSIITRIRSSDDKPINLWIGPEGGFSDHENELMDQFDIIPISIGNHILRVETAVVACLSLIMSTTTKTKKF